MPRIVTGTHTADSGSSDVARSCSRGQAASDSDESKRTVCPRRTAGQPHGVSTPHPGAPCVSAAAARRRCARLESARRSSAGPLTACSSAWPVTASASASPSAISNALCDLSEEALLGDLLAHLFLARGDRVALRGDRTSDRQRGRHRDRNPGAHREDRRLDQHRHDAVVEVQDHVAHAVREEVGDEQTRERAHHLSHERRRRVVDVAELLAVPGRHPSGAIHDRLIVLGTGSLDGINRTKRTRVLGQSRSRRV